MIFVLQAGHNRHDHIMESIERFGTEILPEFAERDDAAQARKAKDYEPIIEAALLRRAEALAADPPPALPEDYVITAIPKRMVDEAESEVGQQFLDTIATETAEGRGDTMSNLLG